MSHYRTVIRDLNGCSCIEATCTLVRIPLAEGDKPSVPPVLATVLTIDCEFFCTCTWYPCISLDSTFYGYFGLLTQSSLSGNTYNDTVSELQTWQADVSAIYPLTKFSSTPTQPSGFLPLLRDDRIVLACSCSYRSIGQTQTPSHWCNKTIHRQRKQNSPTSLW